MVVATDDGCGSSSSHVLARVTLLSMLLTKQVMSDIREI